MYTNHVQAKAGLHLALSINGEEVIVQWRCGILLMQSPELQDWLQVHDHCPHDHTLLPTD